MKRTVPILAIFMAFILGVTAVQTLRPADHVYDAAKGLTESGPAVPEHFKASVNGDERGIGLQDGASAGASPSKAYPRPQSALTDKGYKYKFVETPNWSGRGAGDPIEAIVVHVTGPGTLAGMDSWFSKTAAQVSAHFGVDKGCPGEIHQYVEIGDVAWHAGVVNKPDLSNPLIASWVQQGINPNRRTLGIELVLDTNEKIGDYPCMAQAFDDLILWIYQTLQIPPTRVLTVGHYQFDSVNRSLDPRCCVNLDMTVAYAAARMTAPTPAQLSIEERLTRIEQLLSIK